MIQETIRKHRNLFAAVVFGPIIITFVYWGGSFGLSQRQRRMMEEERQENMVAYVGNIGIAPGEFRDQLNAEIQREARYGRAPTYEDLARSGMASRVLESLANSELLRREVQKNPMHFDRKFLVDQLKKNPMFNDKGTFDRQAWNSWVDSASKTANWNAIYASVEEELRDKVLARLVTASARVSESELRRQFEDEHTKLQIKYVTIEPKIEPTEEQIKAQYDKDPKVYEVPEKRVAQFVGISLKPPKPALVDEIVTRARNGEDFAALAKESSVAPDKQNGGEMGWKTASAAALPAYQKPLLDLANGAVSDAVEGPNGYYLYKIEDERKNETTGQREVLAREIQIRPELSEDERKARQAKADAVAEAVKKEGNLEAAAKDAGLEVQTTEPFSVESLAIPPLPPEDARPFRTALVSVGKDEVSGVIAARDALYVAKVTSLEPAVIRPFEEVRDKVLEDTIEAIRRSPEYEQKVEKLAEEIKSKAKTIADIQELYPDLGLEPKETGEFSIKDYDYRTGPPINPREIFDAVGHQNVGAFAGPILDFLGKVYFIELVKKSPPDEATWAEKWPKEEDQLRKTALMVAQQKQFDDYLLDLREQSNFRINQEAFDRVLGLAEATPKQPEGAPAGPATEQQAPSAAEGAAATGQESKTVAPEKGEATAPQEGEAATSQTPAAASEQPAPAESKPGTSSPPEAGRSQ